MKIRNGFVSNSSSSSFLISKATSDTNIVIPSEVRQLPASPVTSIAELNRIFDEDYWGDWREDREIVAIYLDATKRMADGETLFYTVTDNWDDINDYWRDEEVLELNDMTILMRGAL